MQTAEIAAQVAAAAQELLQAGAVQTGQVLVVGCSTSEVLGDKIGTGGSAEAAGAMFAALRRVTEAQGVFLAIQCCEHLNRALVTTRAAAEKYGWQEVTVRPVPHAGGAMAAAAYENFEQPVVVEEISAHAGLDIGQTLIGMHLKKVAVPVRLSESKIGEAILTAARTRPPLIGGERAKYPV
ncbi:TIGR01440 family protein [Phascolarctobacterium sp.]